MNISDYSLRGQFEAYRVNPDGSKELVVSDNNQIQYFGAHLLAYALSINDTSFQTPTVVSIKSGGLITDIKNIPTPAPKYDSPSGLLGRPFTFVNEASGFLALPTSLAYTDPLSSGVSRVLPPSQQALVCRGVFPGTPFTSTFQEGTYGKYYEFGLILDPHSLSQWTTHFTASNIPSSKIPVDFAYDSTVVTSGICLAYKYVSGGIFWGTGTALEVVWTLYLGA